MAVERSFHVCDQHVFGSATDAMRPQLAVVTGRVFSRVRTRANLHLAGRGYPCLDSASAVEQPPTAIPRTTTYNARPSTKLINNYHVRPRFFLHKIIFLGDFYILYRPNKSRLIFCVNREDSRQ